MIDALIDDGDIVIVQPTTTAENGEMVVAVVVSPAGFDERGLQAHLRETAASFKVPRYFLLRTDAEIPRLASGKVARTKLRAEAIDAIHKLGKD